MTQNTFKKCFENASEVKKFGLILESTFYSPPPAAFCLKMPNILEHRSCYKKCPKWSLDTPPKRIFPGKFVFSRLQSGTALLCI